MNRKFLKSVLFTGLTALLNVNKVIAATEDECAIWLCLPSGFIEGCGGAHKAFKNRLKKGKFPLPSWGSCSDGESEPYSYQKRFKTYTNFGRGKITINNGDFCPEKGVIYWDNKPNSGIKAICTTTEVFTTTFYDGSGTSTHEEERWGRPLKETMNKKFKP